MENFLIYGVFLFAMLCYPAYFWIQFKKRNREKQEQLSEKIRRDAGQEQEEKENTPPE